jgi:hypothetical protein
VRGGQLAPISNSNYGKKGQKAKQVCLLGTSTKSFGFIFSFIDRKIMNDEISAVVKLKLAHGMILGYRAD